MASGDARDVRGARDGVQDVRGVRTAVLEAVSGWVPGEPVPNEALPGTWGVDDAWVRSRTGIGSRHRAGPGLSTGDLAYEAARQLVGNDRRASAAGVSAVFGAAGAPDVSGGVSDAAGVPEPRDARGAHDARGVCGAPVAAGAAGAAVVSGAAGASGAAAVGGASGTTGAAGAVGGSVAGGVPASGGVPGARGVSGVDAVVLATSTPDCLCPATAPALATRLGLGTVPALDIAAVCSGFVYGLAVCQGLVLSGLFDRVLLVGADVYSTWLDPQDRSSGVVFGDGAGAALIAAGRAGDPGELLGFDLGSDGAGHELITVPGGGARSRSTGRPPAEGDEYFRMRGRAVYQEAVVRMTASCRALLDKLGWDAGQVDHFVPHQANARILRAVAGRVGIGAERCVIHLDRVANTGAASIPLALADAAAQGRFRAGDRVLLTAFGGGLTWGSAALSWPAPPETATVPPEAPPEAATGAAVDQGGGPGLPHDGSEPDVLHDGSEPDLSEGGSAPDLSHDARAAAQDGRNGS